MQKIFFPSSKPRFISEKKVIEDFKRLALKVTKNNPGIEAIYLFGSYTHGNAGFYSDADIMVIFSNDKYEVVNKPDEIILDFADGPVPADVLVKTRAEVDKMLGESNKFFIDALKGIRLS